MTRTPDDFDWFVSNYAVDWPDRLHEARRLLLEVEFIDTSTLNHDVNLKFAALALVALGLARNTRQHRATQGATVAVEGVGVVDSERLKAFDPHTGSADEVRGHAPRLA